MKHIKKYMEKSMTDAEAESYARSLSPDGKTGYTKDNLTIQRQKTEELSEYLQEFFDANHIIESSEEKIDEEDTDVWYIKRYNFGNCIEVATKRFTDSKSVERRNYLISELQKIIKHIEKRIGQSVGIQKGWSGFRIGLKVYDIFKEHRIVESEDLDNLEDCLQEVFDKFKVKKIDDKSNFFKFYHPFGWSSQIEPHEAVMIYNCPSIGIFRDICHEIRRIQPMIEARIRCKIRTGLLVGGRNIKIWIK